MVAQQVQGAQRTIASVKIIIMGSLMSGFRKYVT
jgi:hypothetical protein